MKLITRKEKLTGKEYTLWKRYEALPPFHCTIEFIKTIKNLDFQKTKEYMGLKEFGDYVSKITNQNINQSLRLVEVEDNLIPLIVNTNNKVFYRDLFFPFVFLNNDIEFEHVLIKGILICDKVTDYDIIAVCLDVRDYGFYTMIFNLIKRDEDKSSLQKEDIEFTERLDNYLRKIICNFVDLVEGNDDDIDLINIETSREQNLKRIKRGKIPFPTKVYIKAKRQFKKYIQEFNKLLQENKKGFGHKFLVMGHFRHFRAERYKHAKGSKIWIKPFWKGEGIVVSKEYKVVN